MTDLSLDNAGELREFFFTVIESLPAGILLADGDGGLLALNQRARAMLGLSAVSLLGGESLWTKDAGEAYARGSSGTTAADGPSWERLLDDFEAVEKRFQASLSGIDESGLQDKAPYSPFDDPQETLGSLLGFLLLHQAYHAGQIGLLRRVAGLEGAIK